MNTFTGTMAMNQYCPRVIRVLILGLQSVPGIGNATWVLSTSRQVLGLGFSHTSGSSKSFYKVLEKLWRQQDSMGGNTPCRKTRERDI